MILKKAANYPAQLNPRVLFETKSRNWYIGTYHNGYWFTESREIEEPVLHWCYLSEIKDQSDLAVLANSTLVWAYERNLIDGSNPQMQFIKLMEEAGELAGNLARGKDIKDDIGDMIVVLIIIAQQAGTSITECLDQAYNDIKDRKGKMIDGIFVKEAAEIFDDESSIPVSTAELAAFARLTKEEMFSADWEPRDE
jgi:NTP pyrophosphatase (non-canonical NTP hydrolase)